MAEKVYKRQRVHEKRLVGDYFTAYQEAYCRAAEIIPSVGKNFMVEFCTRYHFYTVNDTIIIGLTIDPYTLFWTITYNNVRYTKYKLPPCIPHAQLISMIIMYTSNEYTDDELQSVAPHFISIKEFVDVLKNKTAKLLLMN